MNCCIFCNKEVPKNNKFCNHTCSASFNNKKRGCKRVCHFCENEILEKRKSVKYCSHKCQFDFQYNEFIISWKNGVISGGQPWKVSNYIRRYLTEKYKNKCSVVECGWSEINPITGRVPLQIDHIDGNSNNNIEENLRLLCPNCHSLTPTYGNLNKGNGRKYRRDRYKLATMM